MSNNIVQFNEEIIKGQINELVHGSMEAITEALGSKVSASRMPNGAVRLACGSVSVSRTRLPSCTSLVPRLKVVV